MKSLATVLGILFLSLMVLSCSKEPGDGGNSTIYGKIIAHDYNAEFTNLKGIYPAADEDVFLTYGDDHSYSQRIRSNYDGVYEFKYLRPGDYSIYVYSKDSTLSLASEMYAVIKNVTIDDNRQTVEVEEIKIFK
ncbi:MAG: hypothetical protein HOO86_05705 [Bacteroidales bacterium]|nr:hypothetical protein [Bacteroidales bacterium]